jgi:hypothetical protein
MLLGASAAITTVGCGASVKTVTSTVTVTTGGSKTGLTSGLSGGHHVLKGLVLTETVGGGYVPQEAAFLQELSQVAVYADGRIYSVQASPDNASVVPVMISLVERDVPVSTVNRIVNEAQAAGVTNHPPNLGQPGITDQDTTTVTVTSDGHTWTQSAYALGYSQGLTSDQVAARRRLDKFSTQLTRLGTNLGPGSAVHAYTPTSLSVLAEPANGGTPARTIVAPLPLDTLSQSGCVGVVGRRSVARVIALAARATPETVWASAGRRWRLVIRPDLPGEKPCRHASDTGTIN